MLDFFLYQVKIFNVHKSLTACNINSVLGNRFENTFIEHHIPPAQVIKMLLIVCVLQEFPSGFIAGFHALLLDYYNI